MHLPAGAHNLDSDEMHNANFSPVAFNALTPEQSEVAADQRDHCLYLFATQLLKGWLNSVAIEI